LGWFAARRNGTTDLDAIADFARFPEIRWLNKFYLLPFYAVGALLFVIGHLGVLGSHIDGISALLWGFYVPSFLQIHGIAFINSIGHLPNIFGGYRRFNTPDCSVNRPLLALATLGAAWHNNHHRYAAVGRAGFAWYEIDVCFYLLRLLNALHIITDLRGKVPADILAEGGIGVARKVRDS
jgi:stearoyl-CoA desaturase (delta-9 desaturase)